MKFQVVMSFCAGLIAGALFVTVVSLERRQLPCESEGVIVGNHMFGKWQTATDIRWQYRGCDRCGLSETRFDDSRR